MQKNDGERYLIGKAVIMKQNLKGVKFFNEVHCTLSSSI